MSGWTCDTCMSSRRVGHEIQGVFDGVLYWSCEDCGLAVPREFSPGDRLRDLSRQYVTQHNREREDG